MVELAAVHREDRLVLVRGNACVAEAEQSGRHLRARAEGHVRGRPDGSPSEIEVGKVERRIEERDVHDLVRGIRDAHLSAGDVYIRERAALADAQGPAARPGAARGESILEGVVEIRVTVGDFPFFV